MNRTIRRLRLSDSVGLGDQAKLIRSLKSREQIHLVIANQIGAVDADGSKGALFVNAGDAANWSRRDNITQPALMSLLVNFGYNRFAWAQESMQKATAPKV